MGVTPPGGYFVLHRRGLRSRRSAPAQIPEAPSDSEQLSHCETKADRLLDKEDVGSGQNGENGIGKVDAAREAK